MKNWEFIEGVNIIAKYMPEGQKDKYGVSCHNNIIWFGNDEWVTDQKDRDRLNELNWFIYENSWISYT